MGSVRCKADHKPRVSRGRATRTQKKMWNSFSPIFFFAPKFDDIFFNDFFSIFLESSETHFDLVVSIKFHNIIYGDIVVYFLKTFSTKSIISRKMKIAKIRKLLFHRFKTIAHFLGQNFFWAIFGDFFW